MFDMYVINGKENYHVEIFRGTKEECQKRFDNLYNVNIHWPVFYAVWTGE